jgi:hypothetical protein
MPTTLEIGVPPLDGGFFRHRLDFQHLFRNRCIGGNINRCDDHPDRHRFFLFLQFVQVSVKQCTGQKRQYQGKRKQSFHNVSFALL